MDPISQAVSWLEISNALSKTESPNVSAYQMSHFEIAVHALTLLNDIKRNLVPLENKDLISISVEDMKIVTALMKLVVVYGVYPLLGHDKMVILTPRVPNWSLPRAEKKLDLTISDVKLLQTLNQLVVELVRGDDDMADLVLISPFVIDLLALASVASESSFRELVSRLPTYKVYQLLIPLRGVTSPSSTVIKALSEVVLWRKDAVATLIELFVEVSGNEIDLSALGRATLALASVPKSVKLGVYIEALGQQLFAILSVPIKTSSAMALEETKPSDPPVVGATIAVVNELSKIQPRLLGYLRNLICSPFLLLDANSKPVSVSGNALLRLLQAGGGFAEHLFARLVLSLWLLLCTTQSAEGGGGADAFVMSLLVEGLQLVPMTALTVVKNLLLRRLVPNLAWSARKGQEPCLVVANNTAETASLVKQIDSRAAMLTSLVSRLNDHTATSIVICLMRNWASSGSGSGSGSGDESDPLSGLLTAKAIEVLSSNLEIKKKMFNNPIDIVNFAFSIIESSVQTGPSPVLASDSPPLAQLNIGGDSDDEDSDDDGDLVGNVAAATNENTKNHPENSPSFSNEDEIILDTCLNLLGSVLMEATAEQDYEISANQKSWLKTLTTGSRFTPSIRARADFCYEIANGGARFKDDDINTKTDTDVKTAAYAALREPLVPSRAFGIHLISNLLERKAITLNEAMTVYLQNLDDDDSYIYMNAIKAIDAATKTHSAADVIRYLVPLLTSSSSWSLDTHLRTREALVRLLTPGSMAKCDSTLIAVLLKDLQASAANKTDIRIRISSASILGIIIAQFPLSLTSAHQEDAVDCARGILTHERTTADVALLKASVVLALEVFNAHNEGLFPDLNKSGLASLLTVVKVVLHETSDETLKDLAQEVIKASESVAL